MMRTSDARPTAFAVMVCAGLVCGCAGLPRIDPSGERFFLPPRATAGAYPFGQAVPSYQPVPAAPAYQDLSGPRLPPCPVDLVLCPQVTVAPVGSEVVLLAGVLGADRYLTTNQRIEWTMAGCGPGHFVEVGRNTVVDWLVGDFNRPRKIDSTTAIGSTSRRYLRLARGTATPEDDVSVLPGQAWITVTSPVEGTSQVTAYSPCVASWANRKKTATIRWVDAQWSFPPPAINPAGSSHVFTTTVTRHTDQSPCVNWLVRYEILDGPPAGFGPDEAQVVEVSTDPAGQASVEIFQQQPRAGTNRIGIQVIRPSGASEGVGKRLVVGRGTTLKTWSAPDIAIRKTGPAVASAGATLTYRIEVSNPGDLPTADVVVTDQLPDALTYLRSNPQGQLNGRTIQWRLGTVSPAGTCGVEIECRAQRQGSVTNCAEATAAGGLKARDCATTTVTVPRVDLKITKVSPEGPVSVGDQLTFEIVVTNRGQLPASGLLIKDHFDPGLEHAVAESPIERDLGDLDPGQSRTIGITFRVTKPGRLSHTVEIIGAGVVQATARTLVTAIEAPKPPPEREPGALFKPGPEPEPLRRAALSLKVDGPHVRTVGETAEFAMEVVNTGTEPLNDLKVASNLDMNLDPTFATDGYRFEDEAIVWTIDSLLPGHMARFQLHARCLSPAVQAFNRVKVTSDQATVAEQQASLEIRPAPVLAPPGLSMTVVDRHDPVTAGKELTYEIWVSNNGRMADSRVIVVVTVPPEMTPVPLQTTGPTDYEIQGQTIRFEPVDKIDPAETLQYRIRVLAKQPGGVRLRAQLTSQNLLEPIVAEEDTLIVAAQ